MGSTAKACFPILWSFLWLFSEIFPIFQHPSLIVGTTAGWPFSQSSCVCAKHSSKVIPGYINGEYQIGIYEDPRIALASLAGWSEK